MESENWADFQSRQVAFLKRYQITRREPDEKQDAELREEIAFQQDTLEQKHPFCWDRRGFLWDLEMPDATNEIVVVMMFPHAMDTKNGALMLNHQGRFMRAHLLDLYGLDRVTYLTVFPAQTPVMETTVFDKETQEERTTRKRMQVLARDLAVFLNFLRLRLLLLRPLCVLAMDLDCCLHGLNGFVHKEDKGWIKKEYIEAEWRSEKRERFIVNVSGWSFMVVPSIEVWFVFSNKEKEGEMEARLAVFRERLAELGPAMEHMKKLHDKSAEPVARVSTFAKMQAGLGFAEKQREEKKKKEQAEVEYFHKQNRLTPKERQKRKKEEEDKMYNWHKYKTMQKMDKFVEKASEESRWVAPPEPAPPKKRKTIADFFGRRG